MDKDEKHKLIRLVQDEQRKRNDSLNKMADFLGVNPSWLSRFYNEKNEPEERFLEIIAQKLKFVSAKAMLEIAIARYAGADDTLRVGAGFTVWTLPLFASIWTNSLPDGVQCVFTRDIEGKDNYVHEASELAELFADSGVNVSGAEQRIRFSLSANDIYRQLSKQRSYFDVAIIPTSLISSDGTDDGPSNLDGIFPLGRLTTGHGVVVYIISRRDKLSQLDANVANDLSEFVGRLKQTEDSIAEVVLLPQTAAHKQWDEFFEKTVNIEPDKEEKVYNHLGFLAEYSRNFDSSYKGPQDSQPAFQDRSTVILCAYEPFANNFFHTFFDSDIYTYSVWNLSKLIDQEIEMSLLVGKDTLDRLPQRKCLYEFIQILKATRVESKYDTTLAQLAQLLFASATDPSNRSRFERLRYSIEDLKFDWIANPLANYIFTDLDQTQQ